MVPPENARVVVVTGANEGIGHHLLRALREDGYRVAGLDIETENLDALRETDPERVHVADCDVTSDEDVRRAIDGVVGRWGRIDVLVNNAAVFEYAPFEAAETDTHRPPHDRGERETGEEASASGRSADERVRREFEVNYFGALRTIRAALPHLKESGGIIHNVSSGVALVGHPGLSGYASTKGALEALTRSLRMELRDAGVACTVMHPPLTATRSAAALYPAFLMRDPEDVGRQLADRIGSRDLVVADLGTRIGVAVARRFPALVRWGTERFVNPQ